MRTTAAALGAFLAAAPAIAQSAHEGAEHGGHGPGMVHGTPSQPPALTEPGQGAFAALAEVVRVLEADPGTDWSLVDLDGLRAHLRDMDSLVSDARVETEELPDGLRIMVTGGAEAVPALRRMVLAHAGQLAMDERWSVDATGGESGATLTVTSGDPSVVERIRGLGFFGLMASQDHHRAHHMLIARGSDVHGHE